MPSVGVKPQGGGVVRDMALKEEIEIGSNWQHTGSQGSGEESVEVKCKHERKCEMSTNLKKKKLGSGSFLIGSRVENW